MELREHHVSGITTARSPWFVFWVLAAASTLTLIDQSQLNIALASIQDYFDASPASIQIMVIGHALAYALFLLPSGRLGDMFSRVRVMQLAMLILASAALLATTAQSIEMLIVARIVQGIGAGLLMPQVLGLIQQVFTGEARVKPMGILSAVMAVPIALGPSLGGVILQLAGSDDAWRMLFTVTLGAELIVFALTLFVRLPPKLSESRSFDFIGLLFLAPAVVGFITPLSLLTEASSYSGLIAVCLLMGAIGLTLFIRHERRLSGGRGTPLVDFDLFRNRGYSLGVVVAGLGYATSGGSVIVVNLFLQQSLGLVPILVAVCILPNAVAVAVTSWWVGRNGAGRLERFVLLGTLLSAGGLIVLALCVATGNSTFVPIASFIVMAILGTANGLFTAPNQTLTLHGVPEHHSGTAGSVMQLCQRVGSSIGVALGLTAYYSLSSSGHGEIGAMIALLVSAAFITTGHVLSRRATGHSLFGVDRTVPDLQ